MDAGEIPMDSSSLPKLLRLVQRIEDAAGRGLAGTGEEGSALSLVRRACEQQLRSVKLDQANQYLIGLIDRPAARLERSPDEPGGPIRRLGDTDASEFVLAKSLWALQACLVHLSTLARASGFMEPPAEGSA